MIIRYFILFLLFTFTLLFASADYDTLKKANILVKSSSKSDQFRAYNEYKHLYLRSMVNEDEYLRVKALEGIVKSGTKLHIDVTHYSKELSRVKIRKYKTKNSTIHKTKIKKSKLKVFPTHKLLSARWHDDELILAFDKKLTKKQVHYFTIIEPKKNKYKYVFDIHNAMLDNAHSLHHKSLLRVRLAQYKPNIVRLVLQPNKKIKLKYRLNSGELIVNLNSKRVKSKKTVVSSSIEKYRSLPKRLDRNKVIVIDPGHGGKDPGAIGYRKNHIEKDIVLAIAKELKAILKSRGYRVFMTRDGDYFIKLRERTNFANKKDADLFISIHANAVDKKFAKKAFGIETYFLAKSRTDRAKKVAAQENKADIGDMNFYGKESFLNTISSHNLVASNKLAIDLQRGMLGALKPYYKYIHDGGVREGPFWVLVGAKMPSVLVEVGFVTNPNEAQRLINAKYQRRMALGMANGVERYFLNN